MSTGLLLNEIMDLKNYTVTERPEICFIHNSQRSNSPSDLFKVAEMEKRSLTGIPKIDLEIQAFRKLEKRKIKVIDNPDPNPEQ
ncbi:hypothetical protein TSTA_061540 [Talaromyces stipitatus ATCC 10500]|uniref:Uncharacterized protein n=1 Tax=Talaromyces stipitatus (strain ATCC 10500 / CBS 375.48 / QM 6759 / NRRL 1006) TaxID=441959 RepID=B8LX16_TALSN|nr:uncharacterized protein TSTA_061540 [Talaromyces stipitatus ATCC 10500]EED22666.1 hypothetical protein TSTA_061540 [Talaromyces stipitatus ATCC 10500]